jgi:hypothetical protein
MIEMRRAQVSFGAGSFAAEVSDLRGAWMQHADEVPADEHLVVAVYDVTMTKASRLSRRCSLAGVGRRWRRGRVVASALEPIAIASEVARAASQLFRWRQELCVLAYGARHVPARVIASRWAARGQASTSPWRAPRAAPAAWPSALSWPSTPSVEGNDQPIAAAT